MHQIIGRRGLVALLGGQLPRTASSDMLDGGEIVFGVRKGQAEGDIGIGRAVDMRHAEIVAPDADVIGPGARNERRQIG